MYVTRLYIDENVFEWASDMKSEILCSASEWKSKQFNLHTTHVLRWCSQKYKSKGKSFFPYLVFLCFFVIAKNLGNRFTLEIKRIIRA